MKILDERIENKLKEIEEVYAKSSTITNYLDAKKKFIDGVKTDFNFVGLSGGFKQILDKKTQKLYTIFAGLLSIGFLTVVFPACAPFALGSISFTGNGVEYADWQNMVKILPVILTVEVILIYFFRVLLRSHQSISGQIVQLELRQSLCAFIQSYIEYKNTLDDKTKVDKFEEIVFSGIVTDPGQIPNTFDGLDSIAKLVKNIKT